MLLKKLSRIFLGKPLLSESLEDEKYTVGWGLPILSSDAISSVAYAGQEVLGVLIPVIGILAYKQLIYISGAIILMLFILMVSYRQTIEHYPNGGGAYIVATTNLGKIPGLVAGAALAADYVLTVAVSIASGVQQIASAFEPIAAYTVPICVGLIIFMALGNLRGMREASRLFGIPTYAFIGGMMVMIVVGFIKLANGYVPPAPVMPTPANLLQPVTAILILKAFSNGCAAVTGFEAVSNGVPNFKEPSRKRAQRVLLILTLIILAIFGGTAVLVNFYRVVPGEKALLVLVASEIFGQSFMYYYVTVTAFIILILAANTAYSDFPLLISIIARDGYMPRQLSMRGKRLSFSGGIVVLSMFAILLILVFQAKVQLLIGLYAIGVFMSFTLSQSGMLVHWVKSHEKGWHLKALINGFGALVTATVVVIIAMTKFNQGVWIIVVLIPILVIMMLGIKKHYVGIHDKLRLEPEEFEAAMKKTENYKLRVIVPLEGINRASVRALRYAKTISQNITAFSVVSSQETEEEIRHEYEKLHADIPLTIHHSYNQNIVKSIIHLIESEEYMLKPDELVAVVLPQFMPQKTWQKLLHNKAGHHIRRQLLKHDQIVICTMPLQME